MLGDKAEFSTFNKEAMEKNKVLKVDNDTLKLLDRYIHGARKVDKSGLNMNDIPDEIPIFLNQHGNPYTYDAFLKMGKHHGKSRNKNQHS